MPPFAASEFPLHELGELGGGDVRVRVSLADEEREFVCVEIVKRDEVWFVERFHVGFVRRESLPP